MGPFIGIAAAAAAIQDFMLDRSAAIPAGPRARIRELLGQTKSPVDAAVKTAEIIYANRDGLAAEVLELGAALAVFAESEGYHDLDKDSRGGRIAAVLRGQAVHDAPEPRAEFAPTSA